MAEEKHGDFMKKKISSHLNPYAPSFRTCEGDHSKEIRPCLNVVQNYRFQFEIVIRGKMDCYRNFIYFFRQEKTNHLTAIKVSRSFLLA